MEIEELRTIVTAQVTDFQNKMSTVNRTIDEINTKASRTSEAINNVTRVRDNGATREIHKVDNALSRLSEIALRIRRPFSMRNMRGSMADQRAAIDEQRASLQALMQKRDEAAAKYAATLEATRAKQEQAIEAVRRQEAELAKLQSQLSSLGKDGMELGSVRKLESELNRVAKAAEPAQREMDKLLAKYRETEDMLNMFKSVPRPDKSAVQMYEGKLRNLESAMKPFSDELMAADIKMEKLTAKINSLKKNPLQAPEGEKLSAEIEKSTQKLEQLRLKAKQTQEELQAAFNADSTGGYGSKVEAGRTRLEEAEKAVDGIFGKVSAIMALVSKVGMFIWAAKRVYELVSGLINRIKRKREEEMAEFKKNVQKISAFALKVFQNIGKHAADFGRRLAERLGHAFSAVAQRIGNVFRNIFNAIVINPLIQQVQNLFSSLGDAISAAERQFSGFGFAMNGLRQNALQLQGAFASMFIPLLNIAMPIINQVTAAVTNLFNTIAIWIARITGQDAVLVSVGGATAADAAGMNEAAKATKKNKEEKEKLKQVLAGFDQLTILNFGKKDKENEDDSAGIGAGGGGGGVSVGPAFKRIHVNPLKITDWKKFGREVAQKINNAIKNIDAEKIGRTIGKTLQKAFDFAYGFLNRFKYNRLGLKVAEILNNTFANLDFNTVGATFAEGVNTIFRMALDFIDNFEWGQFGRKISDGIFPFFATIEWDVIGKTFKDGINGMIKAGLAFFDEPHNWESIPKKIGKNLSDAITGIEWEDLGALMAKGFNSIVTSVQAFLANVRWYDMGYKIFSGLSSAINGIEWKNLGHSIATGFNSALDFIHGAIKGFKWHETALNLMTGINQFLQDVHWKELGETLGDLFVNVIDFITTALDNFDWNKFSVKINACVEAFLEKADWPKQGEKLNKSFSTSLDKFKELMQNLPWKDIGEKVGGFLRGLDWTGIMGTLHEIVRDAFWGMLKGALQSSFDKGEALIEERGRQTADAYRKSHEASKKAPVFGGNTGYLNYGQQLRDKKQRERNYGIGLFAQGGVFEPNRPLLGILGDNTTEREIAAPESALKQTFVSAISEMGLRGGDASGNMEATIPVQIFVDGELVEETVTRRQLRRARQLNRPAFGGA